MTQKHTPGPWHVDPKPPEERFFNDVNVLRHDGLAIAVAVHNGDIFPPEPEMNAHLIAAAPDLLEALQWMIDNDETNEGDEPVERLGGMSWNEYNSYYIDGLNRARAAIAKAEGRS